MDVDDLEILAASVILLYEDHLRGKGDIVSATALARGMRMMRETVSPEVMEMCKEFKCQVPAKARS
jgi:hypothetical protein